MGSVLHFRRNKGHLNDEEQKLFAALEAVRNDVDPIERVRRDPVQFAHRFRDPHDQELVGLLAASLAFGNVTTILAKVESILAILGPSPTTACDNRGPIQKALAHIRHRVFRGDDMARLLFGARSLQRSSGTLGRAFVKHLDEGGTLREGLARWASDIRARGGLPSIETRSAVGDLRGGKHILPNVQAGGASKRLLLYLRWMIRPADGIDLGLWAVSPSRLVLPLDTHLHKIARNLGLTDRADASWRTAEKITERLLRFDPDDPIKYDFALCHLGMLQRCPSRRDPKRCEGCPLMPYCKHWRPSRKRSLAPGKVGVPL